MALERRAVDARLADAEREERKAADAVARIDRDYASGELSAGNYERLAMTFADELAGARAQRERLAARAAELENATAGVDGAVIDAMGALRTAISAHLHDGANVTEVRALLRRLFARFVVHHDQAGVAIVPELRAGAAEELAGVKATTREALRLTTTRRLAHVCSCRRRSACRPTT